MLHELLLALLGHTGGVFIRSEGKVKVLQVPFLHPSELGLLSRLCETATHYCLFSAFLAEHGQLTNRKDSAVGFYLRALCNGLEQVLDPYRQVVLKLEQDLLESSYLSLSHVQCALSEFQLLFPALASLLQLIMQRKLRGCALLEIVHTECSSGDPIIQKAMLRIQKVLHGTMYKQLSSWLLHGVLVDGYEEFFICKERRPVKALTAPLIQDGSAATVVRDGSTAPSLENSSAGCLSVSSTAHIIHTDPKPLQQAITEMSLFGDTKEGAMDKFMLSVGMLPSYIPVRTAEKILFVGESVLMFENKQRITADGATILSGEASLSKNTILYDKESAFARALHSLSKEDIFEIASFDQLVDRIRECVAERLWKLVVIDANLSGHLKLVKDFFLLGRGEVFLAFIDSAHWMLKGPPISTTEHDVNMAFQQAARSVLFDNEAALRQFSLAVTYRAEQQDKVPSCSSGPSVARLDTGWSTLCLQHTAHWPLHVLFTPIALERYNSLFKFLLLIRRTQSQLHSGWAKQMIRRHRKAAATEDTTRWQLRLHMAFLVDNLQYYLQVDVIESQFSLLLEKTRTGRDFEAIQHAHSTFLTSLLAQSFLLMKPVFHCLGEILSTCQLFCALMDQVNLELTSAEASQLDAVKKAFQLQSSLLFRLLSSVKSHQSHPHLAQLLLRIDYNRYFSHAGGQLGGSGP